MKITVIIPTYKRNDSVLRAIASLATQSDTDFEVLIVDNAADVELQKRIDSLIDINKLSVRYVAEPRLGVHNARHAGAKLAKGDLLLFADDDVTFVKDWVTSYRTAFSEKDLCAAGGPVVPQWESPPPRWLLDLVRKEESFPPLALMERPMEAEQDRRGYFFSCNMAIRREIFFELGGFNPELYGEVYLGDGESGLNRKMWNRSLPVGYVSKAKIFHHIPEGRLQLSYLLRWCTNDGAADAYSMYHRNFPSRLQLWADVALNILQMASLSLLVRIFWRGKTGLRAVYRQMRLARLSGKNMYARRLLKDQSLRELVLRDKWL